MQLELRGITKRFPGVIANDDVNLTVERGEIVALLGENGAGKTTLMNVLYGLYTPDEGDILVDGQPLPLSSPADAIEAGIGMVHQHFMLVPVFTVAENVILGNEPAGPTGWLDRRKSERAVTEISDQFNLQVDPEAVVEDLPVGVQQRVEIIKVLHRHAEYLVFDEPTAVLTPPEVDEFFQILYGLRSENKGIVFISHKLHEALELADRIVVMRNGKTVAEVLPSEVDEPQLAELMVGRPVSLTVDKTVAEPTDVVLDVASLAVRDDREHMTVKDVSFQVRSGEIVGIAGVQGNGQSELVEALTGLRPAAAGSIRIAGRDTTDDSPRAVHHLGVAHVPEDRQHMGLIMEFPVYENIVLDSYYHEPFSGPVQMHWSEARRAVGRAGRAVRRAHAQHRHDGQHSLGRQPAEGHRRPRVRPRHRSRDRVPADARDRRRIDRVHPQPDRRGARRRLGRADRVVRAGGGHGAGRPHHRHACRPDRRRVRRRDRLHDRAGHGHAGFGGDLVSDDPLAPEPDEEPRSFDGEAGEEGRISAFERTTGVGTKLAKSLLIPTLAFFTALVVGAVIIAITDIDTLRLWGDDPGEALSQTGTEVSDAYKALVQGSVGSGRALSETLFSATPLILTGLAVALGFQAGLFNIGANGQLHMGGMAALYVGFTVDLPAIPLIALALLAAVVAGGIWGAVPGYLKAKTGAHEVITTIMFNFIALFFVNYLLTTRFFQATGREDPISKPVDEAAELPRLFGSGLPGPRRVPDRTGRRRLHLLAALSGGPGLRVPGRRSQSRSGPLRGNEDHAWCSSS